ncbi:MAG: hypothetical protein QOD07_1586 [Frankiaceae bacterium]|nr:hypothetical protein [Frankiaceae bacterium]
MGVVQRFERRLGGLVEGAFAKVFKGEVQPVEVAQALQRETDDRRTVVGDGKVLVPNDFVVELGPHDHERLSPWTKALTKELAAMVREHATEQGYSFVGPVTVALEEAPGVDTGVFRVRSGVSAGDLVDGGVLTKAGSGADADPQAPQGPQGALPGRPRLVFSADGKAEAGSPEGRGEERAYFLTHAVTVLGRATDCDLQLTDPGISRRHAELRVENDAVVLVDLGSTNGIRVNEVAVGRRELSPADRIQLGSMTLIFQRDES